MEINSYSLEGLPNAIEFKLAMERIIKKPQIKLEG